MTAASQIQVFIENEQGSTWKNHFDEETGALLDREPVGAPYPFAYGFVPGTRAPDGDAVDMFLITDYSPVPGDVLDAVPIGLLEQTEAGHIDHNVLATPTGTDRVIQQTDLDALTIFLERVFADQPDREIVVGRLCGA